MFRFVTNQTVTDPKGIVMKVQGYTVIEGSLIVVVKKYNPETGMTGLDEFGIKEDQLSEIMH